MNVLETIVAERLGLQRSVLREFRKKIPAGVCWRNTRRGIEWTDAGLKELERRLNLPRRGFDDSGQGVESTQGEKRPPAAAGLPPVEDSAVDAAKNSGVTELSAAPARGLSEPLTPMQRELQVVRVYTRNRKLLLCADSAGAEQRVRVRNNEFFVKGQVIPCVHQNGNLWTLNGRCPKARGKLYRRTK